MLHLITGTYFSPKSEYITERISDAIDAGRRAVLIVPEQSAFDRERDFLLSSGAVKANKLTVTGFSRIIRTLLPDAPISMKPAADSAARSIIMSLACEEATDSLEIYKTHGSAPALVEELISQYDEIRRAGLSVKDMENTANSLSAGNLRNKIKELSVIFAAYEALLSEKFSDESENIPATTEYLKKDNFLWDCEVFVDDFRGLTAVQLDLLCQIMLCAQDVWVSVYSPSVADENPEAKGNRGAFAHADRFARSLIGFAKDNSVRIFVHNEADAVGENPVADALHQGFYANVPEEYRYTEKTDNVTILTAPDKNRECRLVALQIRNLVEKEELHCRNIAIIERDGSYTLPLVSALKKYGLPVFRDRSANLASFPLTKYILSAVTIASGGFDTQEVFSYLKTGMTGISEDDISALETYVYIWQIDGKKWEKEFTGSPRGFDAPGEACAEELKGINAIREAVIKPILKLREALKNGNSSDSCRAVWDFMEKTNARDSFCEYADALNKNGDEQGALLCSGVWDAVVESLDAVCTSLGERTITPKKFSDILTLIMSAGTVGKVPVGIDEIIIGTADRVRLCAPRAVFLVGCNKGVFPAEITNSGLFTAAEKRTLTEKGFVLESTPENRFDEERLITCCAVFSTADRLYISHSLRDLSGGELEKSEIVTLAEELLPACRHISYDGYTPAQRVGSPETAFSEFAGLYGKNTAEEASLRAYCEKNDNISSLIPALDRAARRLPQRFENPGNSAEFFGDVMMISPSKAEQYYSCPFGYFCRYGLGIDPPEIADMNNRVRGNLIHDVLEKLLKKFPKEEFICLSPEQTKSEIIGLSENYIAENMGGRDGKSEKLNREFDNAETILCNIVPRMQKEFSQSGFRFSDMELSIGIGENPGAEPYEIPLKNGGKIKLIGKVDRADIYENEFGTFVRIVDYKSGSKEFAPRDMLNGLNLQMPMYLFCLTKGGKPPYKNAFPAGFLYLPAKADDAKSTSILGRNATDEEVDASRIKNSRLFGCVLDDPEIIEAMNTSFVNAGRKNKDGSYSGNLLSVKEFRGLEKKLSGLIADMGDSLREGKTDALPAKHGQYLPCTKCKFADICRREDGDEERSLCSSKIDEVKKILAETEGEEE